MQTTPRDPSNEANRLFSHGLHEDIVFNERLNFFLIFESVLLATFATLYASGKPLPPWGLAAVAIMGLVITGFWYLIQEHQLAMLQTLVERAEDLVPEYAETRQLVKERRRLKVSANKLMARWIPAAVAAIWVLLFAFAVKLIVA